MPFQWEEEEEEEESHQVPSFLSLYRGKKWEKKNISPAGNRTPVFRVTGGDTHHYTTEEVDLNGTQKDLIGAPWQLLNEKKRKKKLFPCGESNPGRGGESAES